jgi:glycosyltransferase involved in cell wall biosynthesis
MNKQTVAIDARPLAGGYSGYTSYIISIVEPLLDNGFNVTLLSNRPLNPAHTIAERCRVEVFGSKRPSLWEQIDVPRFLAKNQHDVYLAGTNKGLPWVKQKSTRYILGLLDIIPYKFPRQYLTKPHFLLRELRPVSQLVSVLRADELITISEASARDIEKLFHRPAKALLMRMELKKPEKHAPKEQFFYVGGVDIRKRVDVLLKAFALFLPKHPDYRLVLIGRGYDVFNGLINELGIKDSVTMTGFVDEPTKQRLIGESKALVYPSMYEGYGLAIAEAFMSGVPGIAGRGGSQEEIGGEGVLYIDPTSPGQVAEAMEAVLEPVTRKKLEAGREAQMAKIFGAEVEKAIVSYFELQAKKARQ